ncbi:MAG TPA: diguanylate cyclase, partial [Actinotalea sp.]|nr:diguanylate cyclase [Actinotalea sp.]
ALLGREEATVAGRPVTALFPTGDHAPLAEALAAAVDGETSYLRARLRCLDGERLVDLTVATIGAPGAAAPQLLVSLRDVTDEEANRRARLAQETQWAAVFTGSGAAMAILGPDGRFLRVNQALVDTLGRPAAELEQMRITDVTHPEDVAVELMHLGDLLSSRTARATYEKRYVGRDGRELWSRVHASVAPSLVDPDDRVLIHTALDITAERRREAAALRLAQTDSLTGLANRPVAFDRLAHALSRAKRGNELVSVLFLDLDGFKTLNDRSGHEAGDELLRRVADELRDGVREGDSVARLGGDEFLVLAPHSADDTPHLTHRLAERLLAEARSRVGWPQL